MEATPDDFNVDQLRLDLEKIKGVTGTHDLHVWELAPG